MNKELIMAVKNNNIVLVKKLLDKGANPNYIIVKNKIFKNDNLYNTNKIFFCDKSKYKSNYLIDYYLKNKKISLIKISEISFNSPLLIATKNDNLRIFNLLIKYGAKVDFYSIAGTSLILSTSLGYIDILNYLLKKEIEITKIELKMAIRGALKCERVKTLKILLNFMNKKGIYLKDSEYFNLFIRFSEEINDLDLYNLFIKVYN